VTDDELKALLKYGLESRKVEPVSERLSDEDVRRIEHVLKNVRPIPLEDIQLIRLALADRQSWKEEAERLKAENVQLRSALGRLAGLAMCCKQSNTPDYVTEVLREKDLALELLGEPG
jgi:hypothetical protein